MLRSPPPDPKTSESILQDPRYPKAVKLTGILNKAGSAASVLAFVVLIAKLFVNLETGWILSALTLFLIALIPASMFLIFMFKGLIWYNFRTTVENPSPLIGIMMTSIALLSVGVTFSFHGHSRLFIVASLLAMIFWLIMMATTSEFKARTKLDIANMIAFLFIFFVYSYGSLAASNCLFDKKDPASFAVTVTGKNTDNDGDYFEVLFAPAPGIDKDEMEVTKAFFNAVEPGTVIQLNVKPGLWGCEWLYLSRM